MIRERSKRFTDKQITALRPKARRYERWEGNGFGVRVTPHGAKTFVWVYRFEGRPRRLTIGTYGNIGLADARVRLAEAQKALKSGRDPGTEQVAEHKAERAADTVGELIDDYLAKWATKRKRSASEDRRILEKDVRPRWGRRKAIDITRRDVRTLLDGIVARGAPIAANRTLAVTRKMFAWALSEDIVPANPCSGIPAPSKENQRARVLSHDELMAFWLGLHQSRISKTVRLALKLMLITGQRLSEVMNARWSEFDLDHDKMWVIPGERAKNGLAHRVPLSPQALSLLAEIKTNGNEADWLFPSPRPKRPISGAAVGHAMRLNREALGITDATPHDLRRTAASHMTSLGISRLVVGRILNHVESGVTAVYDRHSYDQEKRHALEAWARRLEEIISGVSAPTNVTELRRA